MKRKSLDELKKEMQRDWEKCFKRKLIDALTPEQLKLFWDDDTTIQEAFDLITPIGLQSFAEDIAKDVVSEVLEEEAKEFGSARVMAAESLRYFVIDKETEQPVADFKHIEDADEHINMLCRTTSKTADDFEIHSLCRVVRHG